MSEIKEPTAFYRETTIAQVGESGNEFPYKEFYDAVYKAVLPFLFERQLQPRYITTALFTFAFDVITTAMAITKYDDDAPNPEGQSFEGDMQGFIESLMILINAMPDATGANGRLLIDRLSLFNLKQEKMDS